MNTLSILIYLIDIISNIRVVLIIMACIGSIYLIMCWINRSVTGAMVFSNDMPSTARPDGTRDYLSWKMAVERTQNKKAYFITLLLVALVCIIPAQKTIYMIAASQMGEVVINTPEAQEIFSGLKDIIKEQIDEYRPSKKE